MIGKRTERCNETQNDVLRFGGNLSRFYRFLMKKSKSFIDRLRQIPSLRGMTIIALWIAMLASIPQIDINITVTSSQVQKILPPNPSPVACPSNLIKVSIEYAVFSVIELSAADLEKYLHTYTIFEQYSSEHARALINVLLYTQTTSSFL
jgi:hypothetical protein